MADQIKYYSKAGKGLAKRNIISKRKTHEERGKQFLDTAALPRLAKQKKEAFATMANHDRIPGNVLKKAFDRFDVLGISIRELLVEEIEQQGIVFDDKHFYKLDEIEQRLANIFGDDATQLLIERIKKTLNDLKWSVIILLPALQLYYLYATRDCVCHFL